MRARSCSISALGSRFTVSYCRTLISHGIARVAEYFTTESPTVIAHGFTSPQLRSIGETGLIDEVRVIISEKERMTALILHIVLADEAGAA